MIIVQLKGGLGNQMFQYACGRSISHKFGVPLAINTSVFDNGNQQENNIHRNFELNIFSIHTKIISDSDLERFGFNSSGSFYSRLFAFIRRKKHRFSIVSENEFVEYLNDHKALKGIVLLSGYFQSEKYFKGISELIRKDFTFLPQISTQNLTYINQIGSSNSVSIHIRRGDYVTNGFTNKFHGTCNFEFYQKAISFIEMREKNLHFFIFSDDIQWVKDNMQLGHPFTIVQCNLGQNSFEDMRLMSLCKHNIIANSSFSWWGAWLNLNKDKIVVAPKNWFANEEMNARSHDLIPNSWIRL